MNNKLTLTLILSIGLITLDTIAQLPPGGIWGCPSIPVQDKFDTTCFQRLGEIRLGQGYFDHYGASDPVYLVIPANRPSFAIAMTVAWHYYRNVLGHDRMSLNQWFATMAQENGFASYQGVVLPATIYDVEAGTNVTLPCMYPRGCNNLSLYNSHVANNHNDGPYHNTLAGYQTISPYVPFRYPGPATTYHPIYNSNMEVAAMNKAFYDLSIYRRAQMMNNINLAAVEAMSPDPYGVEAAQAVAYNLGPNAAQAISSVGYTLPSGITSNNFWAGSYYSGGVSCYAQRVATITAVLDNNEAYATSRYNSSGCGNANNWDFYSFYDRQIRWDTVLASINRLLIMYPEITGAARTAYINAVQTAFNRADSDGNGSISFRYEMGAVIDAIVMNLPKDDPGFNAQYAINGTGCKLDCRAPYTTIKPLGPTTICSGQTVMLKAEVDAPTPSTTFQWLRNGSVMPGQTNDTLITTLAGTYSVVVCWSALRESNGAAVTCCAQPQCEVTITISGPCNTCGMGLSLTTTNNSCTGMRNGTVRATVSGGPFGNIQYQITGPAPSTATTTFTGNVTTYTFTGLRDGKYTVRTTQVSNPSCYAVQDIFVVATTYIRESVVASYNPSTCMLNASIVNQQPNSCNLQVSYGALGGFSWDRAFFMDLKANGSTVLTMYESYPSAGLRDDPWDFWPFAWPNGGPSVAPFPSGAPNVKTISVNDGDTLSAFGITLIPLGTPVAGFIDGGIRLDGATFTNLSTSANSSFVTWRYQPPAPVNGSRQMGARFRVNCPVVSPPSYTFTWSPATGLSNPNIQNPFVSVATPTLYTVTATHPVNTSCQLTASITVGPTSCGPLHADIVDFNVTLAEDRQVLLQWTTLNEINCSHYVIEKSFDGQSYSAIGSVTCNNMTSLQYYTFTDASPVHSVIYYRIKQISTDGRYSYSPVRSVSGHPVQVHIQPNPFTHQTRISITPMFGETAHVRISDINGRVLLHKIVSGNTDITFGENLCSGIYLVHVASGNSSQVYKLVRE
ncbi:MAG: T9SS type A sorting domain-containing protein [Cytophagaceae bacterium]|nr:T9SS type A sorting domain-containing protein [Cytophagaceae bacterium]MDW8455226.1 T9SS type A sorting domain-containing protein [Cytophagaceae bacterium]